MPEAQEEGELLPAGQGQRVRVRVGEAKAPEEAVPVRTA